MPLRPEPKSRRFRPVWRSQHSIQQGQEFAPYLPVRFLPQTFRMAELQASAWRGRAIARASCLPRSTHASDPFLSARSRRKLPRCRKREASAPTVQADNSPEPINAIGSAICICRKFLGRISNKYLIVIHNYGFRLYCYWARFRAVSLERIRVVAACRPCHKCAFPRNPSGPIRTMRPARRIARRRD